MKRFIKLFTVSFLMILSSCAGEDKGNYDQLDDHGKVGDKITDERFLESEYAVVQFSADWCSWCRKQYPNLIEVSKRYDNVDFYLLDVDKGKGKTIKYKYGVSILPTTIYFKNGKEICRESGYQSEEDIEYEVEILINNRDKILFQ